MGASLGVREGCYFKRKTKLGPRPVVPKNQALRGASRGLVSAGGKVWALLVGFRGAARQV